MIRQLHIQDADNTYSCHVRLHRRLVEVQSVSVRLVEVQSVSVSGERHQAYERCSSEYK